MFTDLENFTEFTSGMEPDEIFSRLNHYFSWAGDIISRYCGYLNKTNGDGTMALFGAPS
ncbi:MAG: adenylate/guanylate cyclase domain-containing protein [Alphaproteobacteria bacterium]